MAIYKGSVKLFSMKKKSFYIIFIILLLDLIHQLLNITSISDLELIGFNFGFTLIILSMVSFGLSHFKKIKIKEAIEIGGISFSIRAILSFPVAFLFGGIYPSTHFIFLLVIKSLLQGITYGAFAGWLAEKLP
jgi:hypothetical protein